MEVQRLFKKIGKRQGHTVEMYKTINIVVDKVTEMAAVLLDAKRIHLQRVQLAIRRRKPTSICVVCGANQVRSPLAEFLFHGMFQNGIHPQTGKKLDNVTFSSRGMRAVRDAPLPENVKAMLAEQTESEHRDIVLQRADAFRTHDCRPPHGVLRENHLLLFLEPADRDHFINQFAEPGQRAEAIRKAWTLKGLALNQEEAEDQRANHVPDPSRLHQTGNRRQKDILREVKRLCELASNRLFKTTTSEANSP